MVNEASLIRSDPVYRRLVEVVPDKHCRALDQDGFDQNASGQNLSIKERSFSWIDRQETRLQMRRTATRCTLGAWAMMTFIAIASSIVGFVFLNNATELFAMEESYFNIEPASQSSRSVPLLLAITGTALLVVGGIAFLVRRFPGLRSTQSSIDWATASDAVAQLLATGCSYDESFRKAHELMPRKIFGFGSESDSAAAWLKAATQRVEEGREVFETGNAKSADELKLRLLVQSDSTNPRQPERSPERRWQAAAEHFMLVAEQRLGMLTHSLPPIATILSGIMLWMSISATLGWMWRSVLGLLRNLGGEL
ncbi:hypothetical protein [Rubripirellula obstinata]|nr:hypothetical protein [Rubripirellula obstinata]